MKRALILAIMAVFSLSAFAQKSNIQTVVIQTNGVCQKCADKFSENVPFFKGVKTYSYDMKTAKLTINYDASKTDPDQLRKQISKLGYNADNVPADKAAREALPACCKGKSSCSSASKTCQGHAEGEHKCQGQASSELKGQSQTPAAHKCQGQANGEHKCQGQANGEHKCQGQANGEHKCQGQANGEHKCQGQANGEHKCQGHANGEHKCQGQANGEHKCQGHK